MGLQKHAVAHLEEGGFSPWGRVAFDMVVDPPAARFKTVADCNRAYKILKKGGYFNPRKSGRKTIRFMPLPRYKK